VRGFLPQSGSIEHLHFPRDPFCRVDTFLESGSEVTGFYDSMVAKLICWGETRQAAMDRMQHLLGQMQIKGIATTAILHEWLLQHEDFRGGNFTTRFLEKNLQNFESWAQSSQSPDPQKEIEGNKLALGLAAYLATEKHLQMSGAWQVSWKQEGKQESKHCVQLPAITAGIWHLLPKNETNTHGVEQIKVLPKKGIVFFREPSGIQTHLRVRMQELGTNKKTGATQATLEICGNFGSKRLTVNFCPYSPVLEMRGIDAPITGKVLKVLVEPGATVTEDQVVCVIEAMKMENKIGAPMSGTVESVSIKAGDQVKAGDPLMSFEAIKGGKNS